MAKAAIYYRVSTNDQNVDGQPTNFGPMLRNEAGRQRSSLTRVFPEQPGLVLGSIR